MLLRLYTEKHSQIQREQQSLHLIRPRLRELRQKQAACTDAAEQKSIQSEIDSLERAQKERSHEDRLANFIVSASELLNRYHIATGQVDSQVHELTQLQAQTNDQVKKDRIAREILKLKQSLCNVDNVLSREFVRSLAPEKKIGASRAVAQVQDEPAQARTEPSTDLIASSDYSDSDVCPLCGANMTMSDDSSRSCEKPSCGYNTSGYLSVTDQSYSFEQLSKLTSDRKFTYQRINHFRDTLRQAQGKSNATIPQEVRNLIHATIAKRRMPRDQLDPAKMKKILKEIKRPEYYEERVTLTCEVNPKYQPIVISPEQEEELCQKFQLADRAFEAIKAKVNPKRKNMMSYPSTARRLCELCGWKNLAAAFPLLKDENLRKKQDDFWQRVCEKLGWEFVPTAGNIARGCFRSGSGGKRGKHQGKPRFNDLKSFVPATPTAAVPPMTPAAPAPRPGGRKRKFEEDLDEDADRKEPAEGQEAAQDRDPEEGQDEDGEEDGYGEADYREDLGDSDREDLGDRHETQEINEEDAD